MTILEPSEVMSVPSRPMIQLQGHSRSRAPSAQAVLVELTAYRPSY